jgi:hypothetical protein
MFSSTGCDDEPILYDSWGGRDWRGYCAFLIPNPRLKQSASQQEANSDRRPDKKGSTQPRESLEIASLAPDAIKRAAHARAAVTEPRFFQCSIQRVAVSHAFEGYRQDSRGFPHFFAWNLLQRNRARIRGLTELVQFLQSLFPESWCVFHPLAPFK